MSFGDRRERLLPDGVTAERYTAVFTGILSLKRPGEYTYLTMGEDARGI
jgi:hypothetical protein